MHARISTARFPTPRASSSARLVRVLGLTLAILCPPSLAEAPAHTGGWRLADASSPYLRMHADNPVEWFPWGDEAFAKARREHKPLFISIGYFTCHWCHVMERESFENPRIAALLNKYFVSIKIDREQRPDIDAAYMAFVTLTRGAGGWPMTVFATPEGHPFTGGVYFPPETQDGHIGLRQLVTRVHELWQKDPKQVEAAADAAVTQIKKLRHTAATTSTDIDPALPEKARGEFRQSYDALAGGFGEAPKFPQAPQLLFLLRSPAEQDREMALHTLDTMADGGIRDQLGGGFHRYATDPLWRVPHFEKMLYDQALNARAYLLAWRVSGRQRYADVARETLDFVLARMRADDGSFYAAYAADSLPADDSAAHPEEGAFYVWDWAQWRAALPQAALRDLAAAYYGVRETGNVEAAADPGLAGTNVLYLASSALSLAMQRDSAIGAVEADLKSAKDLLLKARARRPPVPLDEKVVAAWNGYMITALAEAGREMQAPRYLAAATHAADAVLKRLYDAKANRLYRDYSAGHRGAEAFAIDYAALSEALLALHAAEPEQRWLNLARHLTEAQIALFWDDDSGGFFNNRGDSSVWLRDKESEDGVEPGVNSVSIGNLIQLARLSDRPPLMRRARLTAGWTAAHLAAIPSAMPYALIQWPALVGIDTQASASAQSRRQ